MPIVTVETIWVDRIAVILGAIHNFVVLGLLIRQLIERAKKKEMPKHAKFMNLWAVLSIFFNGFYCAMRAPVSFGVFTSNCSLQSALLCTLWTCGKVCLYMFFTSRLDVAFRFSTSFRMSRLWFFILYSTIATGWIVQQVLVSIYWRGVFIDLFGTKFCATASPLWMYWGGLAAWDMLISTLLCFLFITRLWKAQSRRSSVTTNEAGKFLHTIAKYVTITVVGVMSTIISIVLVSFTSWISLVAIDTCVNAWCVFLMYGKNKHLFNKMCWSCHKCMQYCCVGYVKIQRAIMRHKRRMRKNSNRNNINMISTKESNDKDAAGKGKDGSGDGSGSGSGKNTVKLSVGGPVQSTTDKNRMETLSSQSSFSGKFPDFHEIFKLGSDENSTNGKDNGGMSTDHSMNTTYAMSPSVQSSKNDNNGIGNGNGNGKAGTLNVNKSIDTVQSKEPTVSGTPEAGYQD